MITYYVNTASTPGGDGTTDEITGATRAFASQEEFESSVVGLMTDEVTCICSGSTVDPYMVVFSGWTSGGKKVNIKGNQTWTSTTIDVGRYRLDMGNRVPSVINTHSDLEIPIEYASDSALIKSDSTGSIAHFMMNILEADLINPEKECSVNVYTSDDNIIWNFNVGYTWNGRNVLNKGETEVTQPNVMVNLLEFKAKYVKAVVNSNGPSFTFSLENK